MGSRGAPFGTFLRGNPWSSSVRTCFVVVRGGGGGPGVYSFFFVPRSPHDKFQPCVPVSPCHLFFVCKPVVVGGRGRGREIEVGMISILG